MKKAQGTPSALPVFSVDSVEDAESLKILCCRKLYQERRYVLNVESGFANSIETMDSATIYLARAYERMKGAK
jgi:hypothetical protein